MRQESINLGNFSKSSDFPVLISFDEHMINDGCIN